MMADDRDARIAQLEAEVASLRQRVVQSGERANGAEAALTEALEHQTATSDLLRVIASFPTDAEPVLNAVATSAMRLCDARDIIIFRSVDEGYRIAWSAGPMAQALPDRPDLLLPIDRRTIPGRA